MFNLLKAVLVSLVVLFGAACEYETTTNPNPASTGDVKSWTRGYKPCKTEDSNGPCYWNARKRGNGKGKSFVIHKNGDVEYHKN